MKARHCLVVNFSMRGTHRPTSGNRTFVLGQFFITDYMGISVFPFHRFRDHRTSSVTQDPIAEFVDDLDQ